jgi:CHAD domain-containing protein
LLTGYIRESLFLLNQSTFPDDKSVHDIRVLMKKSRALLKLIMPQMDVGSVEKDLSVLKETGVDLRPLRERSVQRKILKEMKKKFPSVFSELGNNESVISILKKNELSSNEIEGLKETISGLLKKIFFRIRFQSMNSFDPHKLLKELESTYDNVRDIYLSCRNNPKPARIHLLRKRLKDLLYQLYIFRQLNIPVIKSLEKKLERIAQNLGRYNDINQIISTIGYRYEKGKNPEALDELSLLMRGEQDKYLMRVWSVAYNIFCPGQKLVNVLGFKLLVI